MATENPFYKLEEVTCEKKDCDETFSVIISSIYDVVSKPVGEVELDSLEQNAITSTTEIDDYLAIKCSCGHSQRIHLKLKEKQPEVFKNF